MGTGQKQTPRLADSRPESAHAPAEADVILKHCRCMDCRNFSQVGTDYFCSEYIGGTSVVWTTGKRECDLPQDAWHYCSHYDGPQSSKDVWLWPRRSRHVGPGSTISLRAEQGYDHAPVRRRGAGCQRGQGGQGPIGTPPRSVAEDRDGNSREHPFCFSPRRT